MIARLIGCLLLAGLIIGAGVNSISAQMHGTHPSTGYEVCEYGGTTQDGSSDTLKAPKGYQWALFQIWDCATDDALATLQFVRDGAAATSAHLVVVRASARMTKGVDFYDYTSQRIPRQFYENCAKIVVDNTQGSWNWLASGYRGYGGEGVDGITVVK